jgi:hypothetical protein
MPAEYIPFEHSSAVIEDSQASIAFSLNRLLREPGMS